MELCATTVYLCMQAHVGIGIQYAESRIECSYQCMRKGNLAGSSIGHSLGHYAPNPIYPDVVNTKLALAFRGCLPRNMNPRGKYITYRK